MTRVLLIPVFVAAGIGAALWMEPRVAPSGSDTRADAARARSVAGAAESGEAGPEARRRPVIRVKTRSAAEDDPARPGYDPVRLVDLTDRSVHDVFEAEPRDDTWAPEFEETLGRLVARDLGEDFPDAEVQSVECRTSSCAISLKVSPEESKAANKYAQLYVSLGETVAPGLAARADDGDHVLTYYGLLSPRLRDPNGFAAFYEADRERVREKLEWFRSQLRDRRGREGGR